MKKNKKMTEKEFAKLTEAEKIAYFRPPDLDMATQQPIMVEKRKVGAKYKCKYCGKEFDELWQLANHRRHVLAEQRKQMLGRSQIRPMTVVKPKQSKILRVRHDKTATTIASTFFIPPNWNIIRVYKPIESAKSDWETVPKIWVCFEPVEVTKQNETI